MEESSLEEVAVALSSHDVIVDDVNSDDTTTANDVVDGQIEEQPAVTSSNEGSVDDIIAQNTAADATTTTTTKDDVDGPRSEEQPAMTSSDDAPVSHASCTAAVTIADNMVMKNVEGPLGSFVRSALEQLETITAAERQRIHAAEATVADEDVVDRGATSRDDVRLQRISADLVTSYGELAADERAVVERQLVDVLYLLTTRGLDVNVYCDAEKRKTALHVVATIPDSAR